MSVKGLIKEGIKIPSGKIFQAQIQKARVNGFPIAFILGTPVHHNLGDHAITYAELSFFQQYFSKYSVIEVPLFTESFFEHHLHILRDNVRKDDLLVLQGGGNMGIEYLIEESCRRKVIQMFPDFPLTIFPQTMDFGDTLDGKRELEVSQKIYNKHPSLTIFAREQYSYDAMSSSFSRNNVYLFPDMVLFLDESNDTVVRNGASLFLRDDVESVLNNENRAKIYKILEKEFSGCRKSDTLCDLNYVVPNKRGEILQSKFNEFRNSELIITDRLHGMVFSAITSTPCIALSNYNNKIRGTYEWIKFLPYIKFANSLDELPTLITELTQLHKTQYSNQKLRKCFDDMKNIILENTKNE